MVTNYIELKSITGEERLKMRDDIERSCRANTYSELSGS